MAKFFYQKVTAMNGAAIQNSLRNVAINGIIFDMDGTLTIPVLNFKKLRERLNITADIDILEYAKNAAITEQTNIYKIINDFEDEGLEKLEFQPNLYQIFYFLKENNVKQALLTRNNQRAVQAFISKFLQDDKKKIFTRESDIFSEVGLLKHLICAHSKSATLNIIKII